MQEQEHEGEPSNSFVGAHAWFHSVLDTHPLTIFAEGFSVYRETDQLHLMDDKISSENKLPS